MILNVLQRMDVILFAHSKMFLECREGTYIHVGYVTSYPTIKLVLTEIFYWSSQVGVFSSTNSASTKLSTKRTVFINSLSLMAEKENIRFVLQNSTSVSQSVSDSNSSAVHYVAAWLDIKTKTRKSENEKSCWNENL